jgi:hypothetical protein
LRERQSSCSPTTSCTCRTPGTPWALAHAAAGDIDAADADYDRAVTALADREQWREAVYVARHWADALRAAGRQERAYAILELASSFGQRVPIPHVPPLIAERGGPRPRLP